MRIDTKKRKNAMAGFKQMTGTELARQSLHQIISHGKRALDDVFMGIGTHDGREHHANGARGISRS